MYSCTAVSESPMASSLRSAVVLVCGGNDKFDDGYFDSNTCMTGCITVYICHDSSQIEHHASARPAFGRARAPRLVCSRGSFENAKHQPWALGRPSAALTRHYNGIYIAIAILISGSGQGHRPWLRPGNTCGARANGGAGSGGSAWCANNISSITLMNM